MENKLLPSDGKINLSNGADLYYINTNEYKKSSVDLFFVLPSDKRKTPLIRLLLSVLFRGSEKFPTLTHMNKFLDNMYDATVYQKDYSFGANHVYHISCVTLDEKYLPSDDKKIDLIGETLGLIEDVLLSPIREDDGLLSYKYFESERDFAMDTIRSMMKSPKSYAKIKTLQALCGDDPIGYSKYGSEEMLYGFTRSELTESLIYFLKYSKIIAYYVGTSDPYDIAEKLKKLIAKMGNREPIATQKAYPLVCEEYSEKEEKFTLTQGILNLGFTCDTVLGDDDYAVAMVYNEILGGSSVSKLFMNVREKKSLCYYCYSAIDCTGGIMMISSGIKPENKNDALQEIKNQVEQMSIGNVTDKEIEVAKKGLINSINQIADSPSAQIAESLKYKLLVEKDISVDERKKNIQSVCKQDVVDFARKVKLKVVFFLDSNGEEVCDEEGEDE